ncbi:protein phosphatase CheZ [Gilvimarinus sp. SDUM040013]|uniref:Protein phosphatase CheZ n=1 Tax=Gilvimarinus gilvus TaxID=3058038 RepID=A0ABU4RU49_9GAMM|nr:protein phosphatase CheZ [Gilvimarinus sp. SDUM040013]MDO3385040.1 protein phosphatase CheZ [Gilvimarinus sp. SDUM040013]MDX6848415.1 protein phosphatase CheZ [Gilvimarinus sp. SDUM040013]
MTSDIQDHDNQMFVNELQESASLLVEKLQGNDFDEASQLIQSIISSRDQHLYQSVGRLTRGLHSAIVNFNVDGDLSSEPPSIERSEIRDATDRLRYVIELTQKAADKTMDMVEEAAPIAMNLGQEANSLRSEWTRLQSGDMSADEFRALYTRMDDFLGQMESGTEQLGKNLQDIILEQGFQDLTGQVLKRVMGLISEVEQDLVSLVRIAGQVEEITGLSVEADNEGKARVIDNTKGEGPQINKEKQDVVSSQDEVDDLLSSLGF